MFFYFYKPGEVEHVLVMIISDGHSWNSLDLTGIAPPGHPGPDNPASACKIAFIFLDLPEKIQNWSPLTNPSRRWIAPDRITAFGGLQDFIGQVPEKPN